MKERLTAAVLMLASLASLPAHAMLFAVDSTQDLLYSLDPVTGVATSLGSTALNGLDTPAGLAHDGTTLYTIDLAGGELFSLDPGTGAPSLVASTGISGWQGLASDPSDGGQLYGINQDDAFYRIDLDGTATVLGNTGDLVTAFEFDGLGTLWGIEFSSGSLGTIDVLDGSFSVVATTLSGFQGLSFATDGTLFAHNTNDDSLYTINPLTGAATAVGANGTVFVKGLAFAGTAGPQSSPAAAPEPASAALLGLGLAAFGFARRRVA